MSSKTIVYLDINHWINLYEVGRGRGPAQQEYAKILAALERLVAQGRVCCPVSSAILEELMKQKPESRAGTASLMDRLSGHVCIQYSQNLARREWRHNVGRIVSDGDVKPIFPVWTMAGLWSGQDDWLREPSRWMRQRASEPARWFERRWSMGFQDVIAEPGYVALPDSLVSAHVAEIADNRQRAISEGMSFAKLLWHTKFGLIESWKETFFREPLPSNVSELPTTIFSSFIDESAPWVLPTLQVYARLSTAITLSNKQLCANDTLDYGTPSTQSRTATLSFVTSSSHKPVPPRR
jgi:hypothetical protein